MDFLLIWSGDNNLGVSLYKLHLIAMKAAVKYILDSIFEATMKTTLPNGFHIIIYLTLSPKTIGTKLKVV